MREPSAPRFISVGREVRLPELAAMPWQGREAWFGAAIEAFGRQVIEVPVPSAVIAIVTTRRPRKITPELAKALLDALHNQKHNPPHYPPDKRAPLSDDGPMQVRALAVEVVLGDVESVRFVLADNFIAQGELMAKIAVAAEAPNDVASSSIEEVGRKELRRAFAQAVSTSWPKAPVHGLADAPCLLIRHGPRRDEDNTWSTWVGVLTRGGSWLGPGSTVGSPIKDSWQPVAIASAADPKLAGQVEFEFYR